MESKATKLLLWYCTNFHIHFSQACSMGGVKQTSDLRKKYSKIKDHFEYSKTYRNIKVILIKTCKVI
jgi:hypothetical protein